MQAYIEDGYTRDGYLAEIPGHTPAVRFKFRPLLTQQRAAVMDLIRRADPKKGEAHAANTIKAQVVSWDVKRANGQTVPLEPAHILRLHPSIFGRLFNIVIGSEPSDPDPNASAGKDCDDADAELQAALAGTSPEETDAKN